MPQKYSNSGKWVISNWLVLYSALSWDTRYIRVDCISFRRLFEAGFSKDPVMTITVLALGWQILIYLWQQFDGCTTFGLILHTPGPEIPDLAYHIHSLLRLLTQLLTLLRHMILQWFQPKWLPMALCIHGKTILLNLLRLLTCHHINVSKISNLSRGQNSCMNMPTHKRTSNIDIIWVYT